MNKELEIVFDLAEKIFTDEVRNGRYEKTMRKMGVEENEINLLSELMLEQALSISKQHLTTYVEVYNRENWDKMALSHLCNVVIPLAFNMGLNVFLAAKKRFNKK